MALQHDRHEPVRKSRSRPSRAGHERRTRQPQTITWGRAIMPTPAFQGGAVGSNRSGAVSAWYDLRLLLLRRTVIAWATLTTLAAAETLTLSAAVEASLKNYPSL